jgi:hypothetical protein
VPSREPIDDPIYPLTPPSDLAFSLSLLLFSFYNHSFLCYTFERRLTMGGYMNRYSLDRTFTSTVTSRCPVCLAKKSWPIDRTRSEVQLMLNELCCSKKCEDIWKDHLIAYQVASTSNQADINWYKENISAACITQTMQTYIESILTSQGALPHL